LADVVFPAFLFIVGLSVPFGTDQRLTKGDSEMTILKHVLLRSLAMIVMGVFHVNWNLMVYQPFYQATLGNTHYACILFYLA